jgi:hypothetical protein
LKESEKESSVKPMLSIQEMAQRVASRMSVQLTELFSKGRREPVSRAKSLLIFMGTRFKGASCKALADLTGMTTQAASKAKERGALLWEALPDRNKLIS